MDAGPHEQPTGLLNERTEARDSRDDQDNVRKSTDQHNGRDVLSAEALSKHKRVLGSNRDDQGKPKAETGKHDGGNQRHELTLDARTSLGRQPQNVDRYGEVDEEACCVTKCGDKGCGEDGGVYANRSCHQRDDAAHRGGNRAVHEQRDPDDGTDVEAVTPGRDCETQNR